MKRGMLVWFYCFFLVNLACFVSAVGISPDKTTIPFEPLKEGEFNIVIINTESESMSVAIKLDGKLARYFNVENDGGVIKAGDMKEFLVKYKLPNEISTPGKNFVNIKVHKTGSGGGGISAVLNIISSIVVDVPYPEKYAEYIFDVENVNVGEELFFNFEIFNKGDKDLFSVEPVITIYDPGDLEDEIYEIKGQKMFIATTSSEQVSLVLNSTEIGHGSFLVDSYVLYDNIETSHQNKTFFVGYKDVKIVNATEILLSGGIKKFDLWVENLWNTAVDGVYVEVYLEKGGVPITGRAVSHAIDLKPFVATKIPTFIDISDVRAGEYNVVVNIYYSDLVKQETLSVVIEDAFEITNGMIIAFILVVLILADIAWMIVEGKIRRSGDKNKSESKLSILDDKVRKRE